MKSEFSNEYFIKGWALGYVIHEQPMKESWRDKFYEELVCKDDRYRTELEDALRYHGVRWVKDEVV